MDRTEADNPGVFVNELIPLIQDCDAEDEECGLKNGPTERKEPE